MEIQEIILRMDNLLPIQVRRNRSISVSCSLTDGQGLKELLEKLEGEETPQQKEAKRKQNEAIKLMEEEIWLEIEAMPQTPCDPLGNPITRKTHRVEWDYTFTGRTDRSTGLELYRFYPYIQPIKSEFDQQK